MKAPPEVDLPRRWQWGRRIASVATALVLLMWSVFLIAWLTLHWLILPHIDHWRPTVEGFASRAIGLRLSIGAIRVQSGGWVPALELQDLRLYDAQGREALYLQRVLTALAPRSLLSLELRFAQVLIEGARLGLRRDPAGRLFVAGIDWNTGAAEHEHGQGREWLLEQEELVIRNGSLHWIDEYAGTAPLELTQLDLVLRNGVRRHLLRLDATPPPDMGERFSIRARFRQPLLSDAGDLRRWSGTLFAELPRVDLGALRRQVALPVEAADGEGALRLWVDVDAGVPSRATLDLALQGVSMRLTPALQPLAFERVQGRLETARDAEGVTLSLRDAGATTDDGLDWPAGNLRLHWRQAQDLRVLRVSTQPVTAGQFSADRLDLQVLARTADRLPLGQATRSLLEGLAPRGIVEDLQGSWEGSLDAPAKYLVSARLSDLALQADTGPPAAGTRPRPSRPGIRGAQVQLSATERGGDARILVSSGALVLPGVWEQPELPLDMLDAQVDWRVTPVSGRAPQIDVKLRQLHFANADMQGELSANWSTGDGEQPRFPGRLDFNGTLQRARAERVARYLPLGIAASARDYVGRAILGGDIVSARFKVKGELADFPFQRPRSGELRIGVKVKDLRYAYAPGWPASGAEPARPSPWPGIEQISGELEFDRQSLRLRGLQGRLWGYQLRDVRGGIADLAAADPQLDLEGRASGPLADLLRFVRATPLGDDSAATLEALNFSGTSELTLALGMPLAQPGQARVQGNLQVSGAELLLQPSLPPLQAARANIDFTQDTFTLRSATARWLGGETRVDGGRGADGALRIGAQGVATIDALRLLPSFAPLAAVLRGQAAWQGSVEMVGGRLGLNLSSSLQGVQIDLPAPLAKPAGASWPLRIRRGPADALAAGRLDSLRIELGDVLQMQYQLDLSAVQPKVVRGSIAVLDALPPAAADVMANVQLGRIDIDAWRTALDRLGSAATPGDPAYLPRTVNLRAETLRAGGRSLTNVVAHLQRVGDDGPAEWRADVSSDQLEGQIEYHAPSDTDQAASVKARLARLSLPQTEVAGVEELLSQPPSSVPALDIVIRDFELRGRKLGRLEVEAINRAPPGRPGQREWQLDRLNLDTPEAQMRASGKWSAAGTRRMTLDFKLDLSDSGAFIERLGGGSALRGGKGQLQGTLSWAGSPLTLDYPSLDGRLQLGVDAGQFMVDQPGAARLIGVLSLQSLSRRLTLDFRDLFQEGFVFDSVQGDVSVAKGVADTRNLQMLGTQATVLMQGSADLQRETQDLQVLVMPNFDASGAALATVAINPMIGLGAFLAQWALRAPLQAAATREFHITGSWAEPNVQPVKRPLDSVLPAIEPAASAPQARARP